MSQLSAKQVRAKFGLSGKPLQATKIYRKIQPDETFQNTKAESWVIQNDSAGTVMFVNTYNGNLGRKFNPESVTFKMSEIDPRKHAKRLKEYTEVAIDACPVAVETGTPVKV